MRYQLEFLNFLEKSDNFNGPGVFKNIKFGGLFDCIFSFGIIKNIYTQG